MFEGVAHLIDVGGSGHDRLAAGKGLDLRGAHLLTSPANVKKE